MVDKRTGTPREIATQGFSSVDGVGIATQGFIEPIIGDIILSGAATVAFVAGGYVAAGGITIGGSAIVSRAWTTIADGGLITDGTASVNVTQRYLSSGGLTLGGSANVTTTIVPTVGGNISLGGSASVSTIWNVIPQGGLITGGDATERLVFTHIASGGLVLDGAGNATVSFNGSADTSGGLTTGGSATVTSTAEPLVFGRGGARIDRRRHKVPQKFELPQFDADDYLTPMDYLKRVQDALDKAEQDKLQQFKHIAQGTLRLTGRAEVTVVVCDLPDPNVIVANNAPLEPIELELPNVFAQGATAIEIAELEDHLFLNDLLGLGDYTIKVGEKRRFTAPKKKSTGGQAIVKFISGAAKANYVNGIDQAQRRKEDEDLVLDLNFRSRQDQEEEELRMLGIID